MRDSAAAALAKSGRFAEEAVPKLKRLLYDGNWHVRVSAATEALGNIGRSARTALLNSSTFYKDWTDVSDAAETALVKLAPDLENVTPMLSDMLKASDTDRLRHKDNWRRRSALRILGKMGAAAAPAVPAIIEILNDEAAYERPLAAIALGEIGPEAKQAIPVLAKLAIDDRIDFRLEAVDAIGKIGPYGPAAVKSLAQPLRDRSRAVREKAEYAWDKIGVGDIASIKALVGGGSLSDRRIAVDKLCDFGQTSAPGLIELLNGSDMELRRLAAQALGRIGNGNDASIRALIDALHNTDRQTCSTAAISLGLRASRSRVDRGTGRNGRQYPRVLDRGARPHRSRRQSGLAGVGKAPPGPGGLRSASCRGGRASDFQGRSQQETLTITNFRAATHRPQYVSDSRKV